VRKEYVLILVSDSADEMVLGLQGILREFQAIDCIQRYPRESLDRIGDAEIPPAT